MYDEKQAQILTYELDSLKIKNLTKNNLFLSFFEGFDIIDIANRMLGENNWDYSISSLKQISQEINASEKNVIGYTAIINIVVQDKLNSKFVSKENTGFGTGTSHTLANAHEDGAKEAISDAITRILVGFENKFGSSHDDIINIRNNNKIIRKCTNENFSFSM